MCACLRASQQVNYNTRTVDCIYQLHSAAINCLVVADGLVVTGSDDRLLRVWPLDFRDYLMEVREGALRGSGHTFTVRQYSAGTVAHLATAEGPSRLVEPRYEGWEWRRGRPALVHDRGRLASASECAHGAEWAGVRMHARPSRSCSLPCRPSTRRQ